MMHVIKTEAELPKASLFEGDDPFRATLRARDWTQTAIGEPESWPPLLRTTYAMMLESHFPMILAWGRELTFLYNAAYAPILYTRHPAALGAPMAEVWPEYWNQVQPVVVKALPDDVAAVAVGDDAVGDVEEGIAVNRSRIRDKRIPCCRCSGRRSGIRTTCLDVREISGAIETVV